VEDPRIEKLAQILVDHSARIQPGDRVLIETTTAAIPLVRALYAAILDRGGHPHTQLKFEGQDRLFFEHANDAQLDFTPTFTRLAYETFESRIRIHAATNTRELSDIDPEKQARRAKATAPILEAQFRRGATDEFKWVTTLFPTKAYAAEADMSFEEYADFVFHACFADQDDPLAAWKRVGEEQQRIVDYLKGHQKVEIKGPNVDLVLSIKDRVFLNSHGVHNMPDGEIYTGPVETSVNGWVRFTYPAVYQGRVVEGVELKFIGGRVVEAHAKTNQDFLLNMLDSDVGARYVGEFAIGTNFAINRATKNILFDEKIGGSFHMALGKGYPETGSRNQSVIHWDMICDLKTDSEIVVDGETIYRNGKFLI